VVEGKDAMVERCCRMPRRGCEERLGERCEPRGLLSCPRVLQEQAASGEVHSQ